MDILEKMSSAETSDVAPPDILQPNNCVTIIHTMADVQLMDKSSRIKTCKMTRDRGYVGSSLTGVTALCP